MDQEIIQFQDKNQEVENFSVEGTQTLDKNNQKRMKGFAIKIMVILIIQTLLIGIIFNLSYINELQPYELIITFFCSFLIIILIRLFMHTIKNKIASYMVIVFFFAAYLLFFYSLCSLVNGYNLENHFIFEFYVYQTLTTLSIGYIYNLIYFLLAQEYIERKIYCTQAIIIIIEVILYCVFFSVYVESSDYFQRVVSILYFQGILTLYLYMQVSLLFQNLNGKFQLQPNQYLQGYLYIQITSFLVCFKN